MTGTAASAANAVGNAAGIDLDGAGTGNDVVQVIAGGAGNTAALANLFVLTDLQAAAGAITNEAVGDERVLIFNLNP